MSDRFVLRVSHSVMAPPGDIDGVIVEQELSPKVAALEWSGDERGPTASRVDLLRPGRSPVVSIIPADMALPEHADVQIWSGSSMLWDGYLDTVERGQGGIITNIQLKGYWSALADITWDRTAYDTATSGDLMLRRMLSERAPWLRPDTAGRWIDPQVTLAALDSYVGQSIGQIAEVIRNAGDSAHHQLLLMTRPGRNVVIEPRLAPIEPQYRTAFDPRRISRWQEIYSETARAVRVRYGPSSSTATTDWAINPDSQSFRDVTLEAGDIGVDAAIAQRNTELARRSDPTVVATVRATREVESWLVTPSGQSVPWWQPTIGEWVAIAEYPALPIVGVSVSTHGGTATYELGAPDLTLAKNRGLLQRQTTYRYATQTAPAGGRLR